MRVLPFLILVFLLSCAPKPSVQTNFPSGNIIEITGDGFSPATLTINAGETVTFVDKEGKSWPASDVHPTHTRYPEPGGCLGSTFDACRPLGPGESFSFTFTHAGSWEYHDHLSPGVKGTIVVR